MNHHSFLSTWSLVVVLWAISSHCLDIKLKHIHGGPQKKPAPPKIVSQIIHKFNSSDLHHLSQAVSCYNKLFYSGYMVQHCVNEYVRKYAPGAFPPKYTTTRQANHHPVGPNNPGHSKGHHKPRPTRKTGGRKPHPHPTKPHRHSTTTRRTDFAFFLPKSCVAYHAAVNCVNEYVCQICNYTEGEQFLRVREKWLQEYGKECNGVQYPPNITSYKTCEDKMSRTITTAATWATLLPAKESFVWISITLASIVLVSLTLFSIVCMLLKKSQGPGSMVPMSSHSFTTNAPATGLVLLDPSSQGSIAKPLSSNTKGELPSFRSSLKGKPSKASKQLGPSSKTMAKASSTLAKKP